MRKSVRRPVLIAVVTAMILLAVVAAVLLFRQPAHLSPYNYSKPIGTTYWG